MTPEQKRAIKLLAEVKTYHRHDRERIKTLVDKLTDPEPTPLSDWDDWKLWKLVHKFRRQHKQCPCLACFRERYPDYNPNQGKLFEEEVMR